MWCLHVLGEVKFHAGLISLQSKWQKRNLRPAWKTRVSQNVWTLTEVKSKIAFWCMFYEKENINEMVIILFLWESLFCNPLLYVELREIAERKKSLSFYRFFSNICKHQHYKVVLNMHPVLWNNYKKYVTQSENKLISMIKLGPSLETRGKSFEKDWTKWNHRIVKMMKLQRLLSSLNQVNPSPRNPRKQQENQDFVGQLRWPIR